MSSVIEIVEFGTTSYRTVPRIQTGNPTTDFEINGFVILRDLVSEEDLQIVDRLVDSEISDEIPRQGGIATTIGRDRLYDLEAEEEDLISFIGLNTADRLSEIVTEPDIYPELLIERSGGVGIHYEWNAEKVGNLWIACKDLPLKASRLFFFPGSQNLVVDAERLHEKWAARGELTNRQKWRYCAELVRDYECVVPNLKRRDGVFFSKDLFHGGSVPIDPSISRRCLIYDVYSGSLP